MYIGDFYEETMSCRDVRDNWNGIPIKCKCPRNPSRVGRRQQHCLSAKQFTSLQRPILGLEAGDNLVGIDFRSGNGQLYAIGSANNVYTLDLTTFAATVVGNFADGINDDPANVGGLSGNQFAFDFNPALTTAGQPTGSFARIISDTDVNRVISGNTGEYLGAEKTDVFYDAGDTNDGANPNIQGIAYTNSDFRPTSTQQYGLDLDQNALVTVANNAGTLATVGGFGNVFTGESGFDISGVTEVAYATVLGRF